MIQWIKRTIGQLRFYRPCQKFWIRLFMNKFMTIFKITVFSIRTCIGYRRHRSTQSALFQIYDRCVKAASNGNLTGAVLLDLSAAFDLVNPKLIIQKLQVYNVDGKTLKWLESYLKTASRVGRLCFFGLCTLNGRSTPG